MKRKTAFKYMIKNKQDGQSIALFNRKWKLLAVSLLILKVGSDLCVCKIAWNANMRIRLNINTEICSLLRFVWCQFLSTAYLWLWKLSNLYINRCQHKTEFVFSLLIRPLPVALWSCYYGGVATTAASTRKRRSSPVVVDVRCLWT